MNNFNVKIGDRLVVNGMSHLKSVVSNIVYDESIARTRITLDWGEHGFSNVYLDDENVVWYKYSESN
jgi:hypothetical protein